MLRLHVISDHVLGFSTIFFADLRVTTGMPSLPLSFAPGNRPPSAMAISALRARDDGGISPHFDAVVLLMGVAATSFSHVLTVASKTILRTSVGSNLASLLLPKPFSLLRLPFPQHRPVSILSNIMWPWRRPSMTPFAILRGLMPPLLPASCRFCLLQCQIQLLYLLSLHHQGLSTRGLPLIWPKLHHSYCHITLPPPIPHYHCQWSTLSSPRPWY